MWLDKNFSYLSYKIFIWDPKKGGRCWKGVVTSGLTVRFNWVFELDIVGLFLKTFPLYKLVRTSKLV